MADLDVKLLLKLIDEASAPLKKVQDELEGMERRDEERDRKREGRSRRTIGRAKAAGAAAVGVAALIGSTVEPAIRFEEAMADVAKVLDFDTSGIGDLGQDILGLSESTPLAADGIAAIVAAAAQAGVVSKDLPDGEERAQLMAFAEQAAQMAVAFDVSAEQAGAAMVAMRNRLKLPMDQVMDLGDAINHLGNNTGASSDAILEVVSRVGSLGQAAGLATPDVAALSGAFVAASKSPEIAATGMQNFVLALTAGDAATKAQSGVFAQLGFDAVELSERMQVDAKSAIIDVMEAMAALDEAERPAALSQLFGRESIDAIAPLLGNLDLLRANFGLVSDAGDRAGSMMAEYTARAATTANNWQLTKNAWDALAISLGTNLLPVINKLLTGARDFLEMFRDWGEASREFVDTFLARFEGMDMSEIGAELMGGFGRGIWSVLTGLIDDVKAGIGRMVPDWLQDAWGWVRGGGEDGPAPSAGSGDRRRRRALGGPVRAGEVYRWMEEGQEMFMPATDGRVASAREVAAARTGRGAGSTTTIGDIHVHAAPGQSAVAIARAVRDELTRAARAGGVPLHDGGSYAV